MTTILNTFILVCSEFLENQISSRQLTISCDLVHPGGGKTVLQWPCASCGAVFEYHNHVCMSFGVTYVKKTTRISPVFSLYHYIRYDVTRGSQSMGHVWCFSS